MNKTSMLKKTINEMTKTSIDFSNNNNNISNHQSLSITNLNTTKEST